MTEPPVSAIIPVFDGARYIEQAIQSILAQTYRHVEILVVDDGSSDHTAARVRSISAGRIRYVVQAHSGAGAARNTGVQHASGQLLAFLDADDLWSPDKLAIQTARLNQSPHPDLVFGHYTEFVSPELVRGDEPDTDPLPGYSCGTMLVKRAAFERVGDFATQWRVGEFIDWYARAMEAGLQAEMMPHSVLRRRIHTGNTGIREQKARQVYAQVVSSVIQRRRGIQPAGN